MDPVSHDAKLRCFSLGNNQKLRSLVYSVLLIGAHIINSVVHDTNLYIRETHDQERHRGTTDPKQLNSISYIL